MSSKRKKKTDKAGKKKAKTLPFKTLIGSVEGQVIGTISAKSNAMVTSAIGTTCTNGGSQVAVTLSVDHTSRPRWTGMRRGSENLVENKVELGESTRNTQHEHEQTSVGHTSGCPITAF